MDHSAVNWLIKKQANGPSILLDQDLDVNAHIQNFLGKSSPINEYLWLHMHYDHPDTDGILTTLQVPNEGKSALLAVETRPKFLMMGKACILILRAINKNPEVHPEHMISLRLWVGPNLLITMRKTDWPLVSILHLKEIMESEQPPKSPMLAALQLGFFLTEQVRETVDEFEDSMFEFESEIAEGRFNQLRTLLSVKRHQVAGIRRFLVPQREALDDLNLFRGAYDDEVAHNVRTLVERTTRYIEDLDLVREKATVIQEDIRATISEQQNQRMYVLSIVTAVFLPLTFLTGVFGMNVAGLPGTELQSAFWILTGAMAATAALIGWVMKRQGWF